MAKVIDQHLGAIRGQVGDNVFKMYGNKSFVGRAYKKYKKTTSEMLIYNRKRFPVVSDFASAINASATLKSLWKDSDEFKGKTPFHKTCFANFNNSRSGFMSTSALIIPSLSKIKDISLKLDESTFSAEFSFLNTDPASFPPPYLFFAIIQLSHPSGNNKMKKTRFITIEETVNSFSFSPKSKSIFSFSSPKDCFSIINYYDMIISYFAVISKPDEGLMNDYHSDGIIIKGNKIYERDTKKYLKIKDEFENEKARKAEKDGDNSGFIIRIK